MTAQQYTQTLHSATSAVTSEAERRKSFNNPERARRRKTWRDVSAMYDAILRAAGFEPVERRAAMAVDSLLWDCDGQDYDAPRPLALALIGAGLTSKSDTEKARADASRRRVGHLFNHAIPRQGFQILTRFKASEDDGGPHDYASHVLPVAVFYAERLEEERRAILSDKQLKKQARIAEARERLAVEALEYLPKCEAELITPEGEIYSYVSGPEAKAYCDRKPEYSARPLQYQEPEPDAEKPKRPYCGEDFKRLKKRAVQVLDEILDSIGGRNGQDSARDFWKRELLPALEHAGERWMNVYRDDGDDDDERERELNHVSDLGGVADAEPVTPDAGNPSAPDGEPLPTWEGSPSVTGLENNGLKNGCVDAANLAARPNGGAGHVTETPMACPADELLEPEPAAVVLVGSINFDDSLTAALWYISERRHVLPVCNWTDAGRCSWHKHPATCTGRKPLVKGDGTGGYSAATLNPEQARQWWEVDFPGAGVAIRMDGEVNIDADRKHGGLESYQFLRDTFDLPPTLWAVTQGVGTHNIYRLLPESLKLLKSWNGVLDKIQLPGIDLKVDVCGLTFAEPTMGPSGRIYRWKDIDAEVAVLPHRLAQFFHEIRYKDEQAKAATVGASASRFPASSSRDWRDQSPFYRDVLPNAGQHARLLTVGNAAAFQYRLRAPEIEQVMRSHGAAFSVPFADDGWIVKTARQIERRVR